MSKPKPKQYWLSVKGRSKAARSAAEEHGAEPTSIIDLGLHLDVEHGAVTSLEARLSPDAVATWFSEALEAQVQGDLLAFEEV